MRYVLAILACLVVVARAPAQEAAPGAAPNAAAEAAPPAAPAKVTVDKKSLAAMPWRAIGPANMGGRITALAVYEKDPTTWWVATASGGLLKTVNNGVTFEHQFDREATVSIGDVAVAPSDRDIVWVGTGESNPRNSVSWGDGVYKSIDGGKTWKNMGLKGSFQIGAVRIHPTNPDIVYVGAVGRCWGENEERGLYKTSDGGKTWSRILFVDGKTGVVDVQMHPRDPDTLLVATWERQRDGFDTNDPAKRWGPGSGLYKTADGGKTFKRITAGLPSGNLGRIGLDYSRANPDLVFMVLDVEQIGKEPPDAPYIGITGADAEVGARLTQIVKDGPAQKAGLQVGDIVVGVGEQTVHSYNDFIRLVRQHAAGETVRIEVSRQRKGVTVELTLGQRPQPKPPEGQEGQAGKPAPAPATPQPGPRSMFAAGLGGQRANLQDQQGKEGHEYGGIYKSTDGGETWARVNSVNPRPMYFSEVRVDPTNDQWVWVLGIRLWKSKDGGATFSPDGHGREVHVDHHALWIDPKDGRHLILGNDGGLYVTWDRGARWDHLNHMAIGQFYHVGIGPRRDYRVYGGLQDNGSWGGPSRVRHASGPMNQDWVRVGGGDGFRCLVDRHDPELVYFESQNGGIGRRHFESGERAGLTPRAPRGTRYRFNWNTPFVLSHHNSKIYYVAGNKVFRSLDRGNALRAISPEITPTDKGSGSALAESPRDPNLLYVGTDDGGLWATRDGGHTWLDLYAPAPAPAEKSEEARPVKPVIVGARNGDGDGEPEADAEADGDGKTAVEPKPAPGQPGEKPEAQPEAKPEADDPEAKETELPARAAEMLERMLDMDANGDGALQKDEVPAQAQRMFARADANQDGVIDAAELKAFVLRMANRRQRGGGRGDAAPATADPAAAPAVKPTPGGKPITELVPERRWVNWIEPSRFADERAYLVFDGHRSDDDRPLLFVTEDFGATWRSLRANLPATAGSTRVLREDLVSENLLYLGTEFGAWVSLDRGQSWTSLNTNLPTVAVHAFALHPTAGEIVAATHGRSLWVLDVTTLRQMSAETLSADAHLYEPNTAVMWRPAPERGDARTFVGDNPPFGAQILYSLKAKTDSVTLRVTTLEGELVRELEAKGEPGLHRVIWDLRGPRPQGPRGRFRGGRRVAPGTYRVVLAVAGKEHVTDVKVELDPDFPDVRWLENEEHAEDMEADRLLAKEKRRYPWLHEEEGND